jgi:hypothetical protein
MNYQLTVTMSFDSDRSRNRVAKLFESLFEFGTIKESIAEGLQLLEDPRLVTVEVTRPPGSERIGSDSTS